MVATCGMQFRHRQADLAQAGIHLPGPVTTLLGKVESRCIITIPEIGYLDPADARLCPRETAVHRQRLPEECYRAGTLVFGAGAP